MKKFRVYFKEGNSIVVEAAGFTVSGTYSSITFFKEAEKEDKDLYVRYDNVIAIIPKGETPEEGGSRSIRSA
jgi:hypothetical protein